MQLDSLCIVVASSARERLLACVAVGVNENKNWFHFDLNILSLGYLFNCNWILCSLPLSAFLCIASRMQNDVVIVVAVLSECSELLGKDLTPTIRLIFIYSRAFVVFHSGSTQRFCLQIGVLDCTHSRVSSYQLYFFFVLTESWNRNSTRIPTQKPARVLIRPAAIALSSLSSNVLLLSLKEFF